MESFGGETESLRSELVSFAFVSSEEPTEAGGIASDDGGGEEVGAIPKIRPLRFLKGLICSSLL